MADQERVILSGVEGIACKSGTDQHGARWIEFAVDYFAEQTPGTCDICGATLESGWLCLDGGQEVCDEHVETVDHDPHPDGFGGLLEEISVFAPGVWKNEDGPA